MSLTPPVYVPTPLPFPAPQSILNTLALLTDDFEWSVAQAYGLQDYLAKLPTLDRVRVLHTAAEFVGPAYARKVASDRWMLTVLQGTSVTFLYYSTVGLRAACEPRSAADRLDVAGLAAWGEELGLPGYLAARREMAEGASSWPPAAQRCGPREESPSAPPARRAGDGEAVNHPAHYGGDTPYEAIKVIEAWGLDFCLGNTVKYISRAGKKGDAREDLEKALWYLQRAIARLPGSK